MISLIVALTHDYVIGKDNQLPWHYSDDLKHFKALTMGKKVIMGSKTYASLPPKKLPGRTLYVASHDKTLDDAVMIRDVPGFLKEHQNDTEEWIVIGGASLYQMALEYVDTFYITWINQAYEGDTYFPKYDFTKLNIIEKETIGDCEFITYKK